MKKFIDEPIRVVYRSGDFLKKAPKCPDRFFWRNQWITVMELESSWQDLSRKGQSAHNMRRTHLQRAKKRGSWGVGRFYFQIVGDDKRRYTIYYDRAPTNDRRGEWILYTMQGS